VHAADWRAIEQRCNTTAKKTVCVGKNGCPGWDWSAACTVLNLPNVTPALRVRADQCIHTVLAREMQERTFGIQRNQQHIDEVMACLGIK
jgi:hypothetical protein